jgi:nitrogen fixation/metabolism regulation signal transduction histidine kinase
MSTSASPEQTGSYKRSARNYLLDSRFQLKYTSYLVGVAMLISAVMGSVLYSTTRDMVSESQKVVEESQKVSEQSKKVAEESEKVSEVSRMNIKDLAGDSPELLAEFNKEADEHDRTIAAQQQAFVDQQKAIADQQAMLIHRQSVIIASLVGGLALMVILIGLLGIYFTHKVAGPVFKMKRLLAQVGHGNLRVDARLRKGDELQDFFDAFTQMVAGLREIERGQLAEIVNALEAVEKGVKDDAKVPLGRVRDAMKAALDGP